MKMIEVRSVLAGAGLATLLLWASGAAQQGPKSLVLERLAIHDAEGRERIVLSVDPLFGGLLELRDERGEGRIRASVLPEGDGGGAGIAVYSPDKESLVAIDGGKGPEIRSGIRLYGPAPRFEMRRSGSLAKGLDSGGIIATVDAEASTFVVGAPSGGFAQTTHATVDDVVTVWHEIGEDQGSIAHVFALATADLGGVQVGDDGSPPVVRLERTPSRCDLVYSDRDGNERRFLGLGTLP